VQSEQRFPKDGGREPNSDGRKCDDVVFVKMEKKTEPKVHSQHREIPKPVQPIKSKGFCIELEPPKSELSANAKGPPKIPKPTEAVSAEKQFASENRKEPPKVDQRAVVSSAKNVRKLFD
jgi:hypothetical protein